MKIALAWQAADEEVARIRNRLPEGCTIAVPPRRPLVDRLICDPADLIEIARDAEVIMGWLIPSAAIRAAAKLQLISYFHAGCDHLDLALLRERGVRVANSAGANAVPVAEHAMAMILGLAKRLIGHHRTVTNVDYIRLEDGVFNSVELVGRTLAVVGLGAIGHHIAKRAKAFDMRVLGVKRDPAIDLGVTDEVMGPARLHTVLEQAHFVVLAVPLTQETVYLIDEKELRCMRKDAFLVNISRGQVIREGALYQALTEGWIAGYAADVWWDYDDTQPSGYHYNVPSRWGIHRLPNVLCSGNAASNVPEVKYRLLDQGAENIAAFVRGEQAPSLIDVARGY
jgi:phosphoglycerate dehydrogenase-like enzyme